METYEFEGKTDQDAIENACRQLNLKKDQMDIVILEPGSAGIFGPRCGAEFGEAEYFEIFGNDDVVRLEIAVDDAGSVQCGQDGGQSAGGRLQ